MYGSKGRMECAREDAQDGHIHKIYVNADEYEGGYNTSKLESYNPVHDMEDKLEGFGHGGSDFYSMYYFIEEIKGNPDADIIDICEALDMFLPGMFAFRSILNGGIPMEIPNLRDKKVREEWRNDTTCTDPNVAGDMLIPTCFGGTPDIEDDVYKYMKKLWEEDDSIYRAKVVKRGAKKK